MVNYCVLFTITLVIGICGVLASVLVYSLTGGNIPLDYGIVIDAGSTHSQLLLYKWNGDKDRGTGSIEQVDSCKIASALSEEDPELAGSSLTPCLTNVTTHLPSDKRAATQIFLGGTAGFRILNKTQPYRSEAILISVQCALKSSGLMYMGADIINGHEEGLFSWISTNFLSKTLQNDESKPTLGALDLGGASTQISFSLNNTKSRYTSEDNATVALKLYGKVHIVQSTSYLCYGIKEIYYRHLVLLIKNLSSTDDIIDPCSPMGFQQNITATMLLGRACTKNDRNDEFLFKNRHNSEIYFTFNGSSNSTECRNSVNNILDSKLCKDQNFTDCFIPPNNVPNTVEFEAFSTFYYVTQFLNATSVTLNEYRGLTTIFCDKDWAAAQDTANSVTVTVPILSMMCFEAHYIDLLLTDKGYGFDNQTWNNLHFVEKVDKVDVGWALGYMINKTNSIPAEKPTPPELNLTITILLLVISICILIGSGVFFRKYRREATSTPGYLSV